MSHVMMFTALPRGYRQGQLRLSVLISPRINIGGAPTTLAAMPSSLLDWPSLAKKLTFQVQFDLLPPVVAQPDPDSICPFDSALWASLFPASTPVRPFAFKRYDNAAVSSFGAQTVASHVHDVYAQMAQSPTRPIVTKSTSNALTTSVSQVSGAIAQVHTAGPAIDPRSKSLGQALLSKSVISAPTPHGKEFLRAAVYYNRRKWREAAGVPAASSAPPQTAPDRPDFHQILGQLGDHPALLRRLGVILDLVVSVPATVVTTTNVYIAPAPDGTLVIAPVGASTDGQIMLGTVGGASASAKIVHPWTACTLTATSFQAWSASNEFTPDTLELNLGSTGPFAVETLDVDHAVMHYSDFADHATTKMSEVAQSGDPSAAIELAMPALHTEGFTIHRDDREAIVGQRFNRQYTFDNDPSRLRFVAEELMQGYRVEVKRDSDPWRSLCDRTVKMAIGGTLVAAYQDHGHVKGATLATTSPDVDIYNLHEALFQWKGWSLCATRPGRAVQHDAGTNRELGSVMSNASPASFGTGVATRIVATPGTLPRLRFGSSYSFRVVPVDVAGNDMASGRSPSAVSPAKLLQRHDPVSPPTVVLRAKLTEGESVEHLVIRSNPYGAAKLHPNEYAAWINSATVDGAPIAMNPYAGTCERHIAPPKVSQHLAELHGAFDPFTATPDMGYAVASKEAGTFLDMSVIDASSTTPVRVGTSRAIVTPPGAAMPDGSPIQYPDPTGEVNRGDALAHGQYVIHTADTPGVVLPYLPDPNSAGLALQIDPASAASVAGASSWTRSFHGRNGAAWPELGLVKLVLQEAPGAATIAGDDTTASSATAALAVSLPPASTMTLQYSSMVANPDVMALAPSAQRARVARGGHAMVSPTRKLVLVHAVQQPARPVLSQGSFSIAPRGPGDTSATIRGTIDSVDGASSAKVDLVASWNEYVDVPSADPAAVTDPSASPVPHTAIVDSIALTSAQRSAALGTLTHAFGDTKYRRVIYQAVATTRFREYFPAALTADPANITSRSTPFVVPVFSTARPPAPEVMYVVPSFKWVQPSATTRTRVGGAVRVYVDRGWFATGEDERLGVVLATSAAQAKATPNTVSVWGDDPIWIQKSKVQTLDIAHFVPPPGAASDQFFVMRNVPLAESGAAVHVVTFKPQFNKDRQRWYFDIELTTDGSYMPFVRLALARVQPHSVADLYLSPVVKAEFAQMVNDRTLAIAQNVDGSWSVNVTGVVGSNYDWPSAASGGTRTAFDASSGHAVTVEVQESTNPDPDALDWKRVTLARTLTPSVTPANGVYPPVVSYQGSLTPPAPIAGTVLRRILVREWEHHAADDQSGVKYMNGSLHVGSPEGSVPFGRRLVYADALVIPM